MKQNGFKLGFFQSTYKYMTIISINLYFPKYGVTIFSTLSTFQTLLD
jgi:hypothetical protein